MACSGSSRQSVDLKEKQDHEARKTTLAVDRGDRGRDRGRGRRRSAVAGQEQRPERALPDGDGEHGIDRQDSRGRLYAEQRSHVDDDLAQRHRQLVDQFDIGHDRQHDDSP